MRVEISRRELQDAAALLGIDLSDEKAQDIIVAHQGHVEGAASRYVRALLPAWLQIQRPDRRKGDQRHNAVDRRHYCPDCNGRISCDGSCACKPSAPGRAGLGMASDGAAHGEESSEGGEMSPSDSLSPELVTGNSVLGTGVK